MESAQLEPIMKIKLFSGLACLSILVTAVSAAPTANIIPVAGPLKSDASYEAFITGKIAVVKDTGTSPDKLTVLVPDNLIGGSVWWIVDLKAGVGETIFLIGTRSEIVSNDVGSDATNILGQTIVFGPTDLYSTGAVCFRADGTVITDGSPDQTCARIIFAVGTKHFNATSAEVHKYTDLFKPWTLTFLVTAHGTTATSSLSTTSVLPRLSALKVGADFIVKAEDNGDNTDRPIQKAVALGGPATDWSPVGTIHAGQERNLGATDSSALFVRYAP
jgi:hypothetical protein